MATVLEGSVRRQQNRVRITVDLTDALQGKQVWSEQYERNLSDVFAVQEEIATAIAARLSIQLGASRPRAERPPSHSVQAYELYLRGRHFVQQRGGAMARGHREFPRGHQARPGILAALRRDGRSVRGAGALRHGASDRWRWSGD